MVIHEFSPALSVYQAANGFLSAHGNTVGDPITIFSLRTELRR
jgi:hypothetical protein